MILMATSLDSHHLCLIQMLISMLRMNLMLCVLFKGWFWTMFPCQIPALVSLKKLSTVSFAGVDSLDDVKNHTYNELFVSGGFVVSDEFVLNPDYITHGESWVLVGQLLW